MNIYKVNESTKLPLESEDASPHLLNVILGKEILGR